MPGGRTRKADVRNGGIQCSAQDVPMSGGTVRPPTRAGTVLLIPVAQNPRPRRETPVSRPARAVPEQVPRGDPRAVREIKNERFQLHKPPVSTYPFPLATAFSQSSASDEKSDLPHPCLKKQGRRGGHSLGEGPPSPKGEPFPSTFPLVGKSRPCAGSAKQTIIACKESEAKLQSPCGAKTNKKL